ncbi:MAG: hypothetical protein KJO23_04770, partial [Bacteroidia bacterium]|nr:hypothetical protein [Bacteroidia bacterium]NNM23556.1 hypothetical protein [Flavobacteriaceae bacterium]
MDNPLLQAYDAAPFSKIKTEHFLPAVKELIKQTQAEIDRIVNNSDSPSFSNTVAALENTGDRLGRA